jgi:hypothetical protein
MRSVLQLAAVLALGIGSVSTLAMAQDAPGKDVKSEQAASKATTYKAVIDGMT